MSRPLAIIGLGAEGLPSLSATAVDRLQGAGAIVGAPRQLELIRSVADAQNSICVELPTPLLPNIQQCLETVLSQHDDVVLLASGDPTFHGIAATVQRMMPKLTFEIFPAVSSVALACARLQWPQHEVAVKSLLTQDASAAIGVLETGRHVLLLSRDAQTPVHVRQVLVDLGQADRRVAVLEQLGSPAERILLCTAAELSAASSNLNIVAVFPTTALRAQTPGLADSCYETDGQLTKQDVRALTVCALGVRAGELLWDIGGGSGSIAIEALRAQPYASAVCFEHDPVRSERISRNALRLGTPQLVIDGKAPSALGPQAQRRRPDVVFIGGGLTASGVFAAAWDALLPGGRLVANAVTVESEQMLWQLRKEFGGSMHRFEIAAEHAVGSFTTMKPALPVVQWRVTKPCETGSDE